MSTADEKKGSRKTKLTGVVVSDKMNKTISVKVDRYIKHPVVKKFIKRSSKFMAHDEKMEAKMGDVVRIVESRPISKNKRWKLEAIVKKAIDINAALSEEAVK